MSSKLCEFIRLDVSAFFFSPRIIFDDISYLAAVLLKVELRPNMKCHKKNAWGEKEGRNIQLAEKGFQEAAEKIML